MSSDNSGKNNPNFDGNIQHIVDSEDPCYVNTANSVHQNGATFCNIDGCHSNVMPKASTITNTSNTYSVLRVRIALLAIIALSCTVFTLKPLIAQFLVDRWSSNHSTGFSEKLCDRNTSNSAVIENDDIQSRASMATLYYSYATNIPALLSCLVFGALVDLVGRKPALISSLLGSTCLTILVICIIGFDLSTNFFYLAYGLDGIGGSFFVNLMACYSITADISGQKDHRILGIAIICVVANSVFVGMNVAVGILIKKVGYVVASLVILPPPVLALLIAIFLLPETLPTQKQKGSLKKVWEYTTRIVFLYIRDGTRRTRWTLLISLLIFFTSLMNILNIGTMDTLYQMHEPLCWDSAQLGYYSAFRNSGGNIIALFYLWIRQCVGCGSDEVLSMVGMLFLAGGYLMEGFVTTDWQMYTAAIICTPGFNVAHITRGVMSVLVGPEKQGVMFSSVALIEVLCSMLSTSAYNKVYAVTVNFMPGFVYFIMAGVSVTTFLLYIPFFHFYDCPPRSYHRLVQARDDDVQSVSSPSTSTSTSE